MSTGVEYILRARDLLSGVLRNAARAAENVSRSTNEVGSNTQRSMTIAQRAIQRAEQSWRGYIDRVRESNNNTNDLAGSIRNVVGAMALFQGVKSIVKMGADLEQSKISFDVLLGSAQKAKIMLDGINKFANDTPYENKGLIDNAKMMLSFGTSAEKILPNLKMLGDIAMGDANKMSSLTLAFSQMSSAGKLQGQDLLQMINAGFNPLQIMAQNLAKSTGITFDAAYAKMRKHMEDGKVSASMVEAAFKQATSKGGLYFGMMEKMSKTTWGIFSTLLGTIRQTGAEIGLKILPYINSLINFLIPLADWISRNSDLLIQLVGVLLGAMVAFKLVTGAMALWSIASEILAFATGKLTFAQLSLNAAMLLNPIGIVVGAIAVLIGLIVIAWNKFAWFRGGVMGLWETFKLFVTFLKDAVINTVKGLIDMFSGLGKIIKGIFSGNFDEVKLGAKQAASGFANSYGGLGIVKAAQENGSKIGETWAKGYNKGLDSFAKSKADKKAKDEGAVTDANTLLGGGYSLSGANTTNQTINPDDKIKSIAGGGSKPTNITINLNKEMVGSITVQSTNVTEGAGRIKDIVIEAMAEVLNSANRLATE